MKHLKLLFLGLALAVGAGVASAAMETPQPGGEDVQAEPALICPPYCW